jgi:transcriptional regulator GlxA family with amidase domain
MNAPNKRTSFAASVPPSDATISGKRLPATSCGQLTTDFLVLVLPGFSQFCLSSLIDPLRLANSLSGSDTFRWRLVSRDGNSVQCASGITVEVSGNLVAQQKTLGRRSALVILAVEAVERHSAPDLRGVLRRCARDKVPIYALGTATWLLAEAAILGQARCTIHWRRMAALSETFRDLAIDDALFVHDGQIVTCAGEFAAFDLAIDLIRMQCGIDLVRSICQHVAVDRWRERGTRQSVPSDMRYAGAARRLLPIIQLMEKHLEEPLSMGEISRRVLLSRRQIGRLFVQFLSTTPWRHYLALRLTRAHQLLELTDMPIIDVAVACGFVSSSHFSKAFRDHFSLSPTDLRRWHTAL